MFKFTWDESEPIIDKCDGCDFITERLKDKAKICLYSFHPETEWLMGLCPRATHIKKED